MKLFWRLAIPFIAVSVLLPMMPVLWKMVHVWGRYPPYDDEDLAFLKAHYPLEMNATTARIDKWKARIK